VRNERDVFAEDCVWGIRGVTILRASQHEVIGQENSTIGHKVVNIFGRLEVISKPKKNIKRDRETLTGAPSFMENSRGFLRCLPRKKYGGI
jgi:hypothetical protein